MPSSVRSGGSRTPPTWSNAEPATATSSPGLPVPRPAPAGRGARTASATPSWARPSTTKTTDCQGQPARRRPRPAASTTARSAPPVTSTSPAQPGRRAPTRGASGAAGAWRPGSAGSAPSATPGRPWVSRLIHRICAGSSGTGSPKSGPSSMTSDLGDAAGQGVAQEPADVVVDPPALADRRRRRWPGRRRPAPGRRPAGRPRCRAPMATPMSARRSAGASLTPSPVIATTSPAACRARR